MEVTTAAFAVSTASVADLITRAERTIGSNGVADRVNAATTPAAALPSWVHAAAFLQTRLCRANAGKALARLMSRRQALSLRRCFRRWSCCCCRWLDHFASKKLLKDSLSWPSLSGDTSSLPTDTAVTVVVVGVKPSQAPVLPPSFSPSSSSSSNMARNKDDIKCGVPVGIAAEHRCRSLSSSAPLSGHCRTSSSTDFTHNPSSPSRAALTAAVVVAWRFWCTASEDASPPPLQPSSRSALSPPPVLSLSRKR
mmetsp:Transcript_13938/g.27712  ORF Transcript_13938/g.27712 Transcript_13938/m.27712 type:complete len:253 (-) Transcript_13938:197-955(-)